MGAGQALNQDLSLAGRNRNVNVVVLEEEALAGVARRKREPQAIPAIGLNPGGAESVAICLDVDIPSLWANRWTVAMDFECIASAILLIWLAAVLR